MARESKTKCGQYCVCRIIDHKRREPWMKARNLEEGKKKIISGKMEIADDRR